MKNYPKNIFIEPEIGVNTDIWGKKMKFGIKLVLGYQKLVSIFLTR